MLDFIEVDDMYFTDADQGQVFQDFVTKCSCANDQDFCGREFFLIPPTDKAQT